MYRFELSLIDVSEKIINTLLPGISIIQINGLQLTQITKISFTNDFNTVTVNFEPNIIFQFSASDYDLFVNLSIDRTIMSFTLEKKTQTNQ